MTIKKGQKLIKEDGLIICHKLPTSFERHSGIPVREFFSATSFCSLQR